MDERSILTTSQDASAHATVASISSFIHMLESALFSGFGLLKFGSNSMRSNTSHLFVDFFSGRLFSASSSIASYIYFSIVFFLNLYLIRKFVFIWLVRHVRELTTQFAGGAVPSGASPLDARCTNIEDDDSLVSEEILILPSLGIQHSIYKPGSSLLSFLLPSRTNSRSSHTRTKFYSLHNLRNLIINEAIYKVSFIYYLGFLVKGEEDEIVLLLGECGEWMRRWVLREIYADVVAFLSLGRYQSLTNAATPQKSDALPRPCWIRHETWFRNVPTQISDPRELKESNGTSHPLICKVRDGEYQVALELATGHWLTCG